MIRQETWKKMGRAGLLDDRLKPYTRFLPHGVPFLISTAMGLAFGLSGIGNKPLWSLLVASVVTLFAVRLRSEHFEGYLIRRHLMGAYVFQEQLDKWGEGTENAFLAGSDRAQEYCDNGINRRAYALQSIVANTVLILMLAYLLSWLKE